MGESASLHEIIARIYDDVFHIPFEDFRLHVMHLLGELIPFDSGAWAAGAHDENIVYDWQLVNQEPHIIAHYAMNYGNEDFVRRNAVAHPGKAFMIEDFYTIGQWHELPIYGAFCQPLGIEYSLGAAGVDPLTKLEELIVLWRCDTSPPYTEAERVILANCVGHMFAAWRHRQMIHLFEHASATPDTQQQRIRSHAVINEAGLIHAASSDFSALLSEAYPAWRGPAIPEAVLARVDADERSFVVDDLEFTVTPGTQRHLISVSERTETSILTSAEARTARLFAANKTAGQIAEECGISQSTVRNQISSAYAKLKVHTKLELARQLGGQA